MRKMLSLMLGVMIGIGPVSAFAAPTKATQPQNSDTTGFLQPTPLVNLEFIGAIPGSVAFGSNSAQVATGAGVLYAVCPSVGGLGEGSTAPALTNYVIAFDVAALSSLLGGGSAAANVQGGAFMPLTPAIFPWGLSTPNSGGALAGTESQCWQPRVPIQFQNGLAVAQTNANMATVVYWRPLSGPASAGSGPNGTYW